MDIYWVVKGGGDPLDLICALSGRFPLLHLKDATPAPARNDGGRRRGDHRFREDLRPAKAQAYKHVFVEHDEPCSIALASARAS